MRILGFQIGRKDSAVGPLISMRKVGKPVWSERNFKAFAKEGYTQNVIAYRAIRLIAENVASIIPLAYEGRRELSEHPFLTVLNRPNPWQGRAELIDALVAYYRIAGNGYLEAVSLDDTIRELYTLRPDRMKCIAGRRGYPQAWQYCIDGEAKATFPMDLGPTKQLPIFHLKDFNPTDDWYGLSPMEAAAFAIDVHNAAGAYNKALLDNSAAPSGALSFEGGDGKDNQLTDDQFTRLKREMDEKMSGAKNAGRPLLLEGGLKWQAMGFSPKDLEFTSGKSEAAREIALAFGIPPMILGIPGDNTYSNYQEANRALWRQTILPMADRIYGGISNWVQPSYPGLRLGYDLDQIEALMMEREAAWKRVENADFITTDEKREAVGYGPYKPDAKKPGGQILVGGGMVPLDEAGFMPGGPEPVGEDEDAEPAEPAAAEE